MNKFLITKVFSDSGFIRPDTLVYDEVELRPAKFDLSEERDAITKSVKNFSASVNVDVNTRITTIVTASSEDDALLLADNNFIEIIDVLSVNFPISLVELSECGFVKNLSDGEIKPLNKKQSYLSNSFLVRKTKFPSFDNEQWLIQQTTELSIRYRRSLHWSRKSKIETNIQMKILFSWFSVEALFKEDENDSVSRYISWFLGYPTGPDAKRVSPELISKLKSNPLYDQWKKRIKDGIEKIRIFRNDSVHSGFRSVDFDFKDMLFYNNLMIFGCSRCQSSALQALHQNITSVSEFNEYIAELFENNTNLINDVHGNILYSLQNPIGSI